MWLRGKGELLVTVLLLVLVAWAVYQAIDWPPRTRLFPLAVGIPMLALVAFKLLRDLSRVARGERLMSVAGGGDQAEIVEASWGEMGKVTGWLLSFFVVVWSAGLLWAIPLFTFAYLKLSSRESVMVSAIGAVGAWLFTWGIFDQLLHLPFPPPALLSLLGQA